MASTSLCGRSVLPSTMNFWMVKRGAAGASPAGAAGAWARASATHASNAAATTSVRCFRIPPCPACCGFPAPDSPIGERRAPKGLEGSLHVGVDVVRAAVHVAEDLRGAEDPRAMRDPDAEIGL